ncbi:hypothetical protein Desor_5437 [Desulfosporosinus orientis DSM 765]|uniref:Chloroplast import component protein (Tic20) n=1 Tax=Desulfosporosinus orientis (strain ATCC 19365 / DSM 765 / NCIMB 8382 / VKM B-1628 / Singapore I) TaxID=768706 RepID=G7WEJ9_DESOD|nr:hypothetical protein [Desulfosporosinus orientis]AET70812.1 hypothetical protein Desor_5437 [Desulfosporosinus orientis DSM 765]
MIVTEDDVCKEKTFDPTDIEQNKTMAALAYILFFLPLIACKDSEYGRFHANQGLLLLIISVVGSIVISIVSSTLIAFTWHLFWFTSLLHGAFGLLIIFLVITGFINGLNGKAKQLPIIGQIQIIK